MFNIILFKKKKKYGIIKNWQYCKPKFFKNFLKKKVILLYYRKISLLSLIFNLSNQILIHPALLQALTTFYENPKRIPKSTFICKKSVRQIATFA